MTCRELNIVILLLGLLVVGMEFSNIFYQHLEAQLK